MFRYSMRKESGWWDCVGDNGVGEVVLGLEKEHQACYDGGNTTETEMKLC